jgi:heptosyltransferase-2
VLGLGAFDPARDWPRSHWVEFLNRLREHTTGTVFIVGGSANAARARTLIEAGDGSAAVNACGATLAEALALLEHADLFVGNDSGPMNLAVAVSTPAFVLFGVNPVLNYSKFIHPIVPEGGPSPGGMGRITPAQVIERIGPYLPS